MYSPKKLKNKETKWAFSSCFCFFSCILPHNALDPWAEAEGTGPWGQVQKACPAKSEGVSRRDDESPPGLQTQRFNGPQSQPQVCEERGCETGQGTRITTLTSWLLISCVSQYQNIFSDFYLFFPGSLHSQVLTSEVGDWRKNVEAMSGMEGRKKMFDTGGGAQWDHL